jgi:phosphatidylglycerol:prolipoprotein diacylglycerol transferase
MYPDLSYIFHDLFGTPVDGGLSLIKTFGLLLVLAILTAAFFLNKELKRKATEGLFKPIPVKIIRGAGASNSEIISNGLWGLVLGLKIPHVISNYDKMLRDPSGVLLNIEGNWLLAILGAALFGGYTYWQGQRKKLPKPQEITKNTYPHDLIGPITMIAAVSGVVGAKVFAIIEDLPAFFDDPAGMFFSGSGLAIYGGLIGGFLGVSWYLRRKNIPIIHVLDAVAPALIIAYGVGRLGCHFSGDGDWGIEHLAAIPDWWFLPDWLWSYDYPRNVINEGVLMEGCTNRYCHKLAAPVYPTAFYETLMAFAIFGILWFLRKRITIPGMLFFIYLIFNGLERFWIEKIRVNIDYDFLGMKVTQAEVISVVLFLIGVVGTFVLWRRAKGIRER